MSPGAICSRPVLTIAILFIIQADFTLAAGVSSPAAIFDASRPLSPVEAARVICEQRQVGRTLETYYCLDGYECNLAERKCVPGAAMQQRILEERRQKEAARQKLYEEQERATAAKKVFDRQERVETRQREASRFVSDGKTVRECGPSRLWSSPVDLCVGDAARNVTGPIVNDPNRVPTIRNTYNAPNAAQNPQPPQQDRQPVLRDSLRRQNMGDQLASTIRDLASTNIDAARRYVKSLEDVRTQFRDSKEADRLAQLDSAIALGKQLIDVAAAPPAATSAPSTENVRAPRPEANEALCSFLIDLSRDQPGRPSSPLPEICRAYAAYVDQLPRAEGPGQAPTRDARTRPVFIPESEIETLVREAQNELGAVLPKGF